MMRGVPVAVLAREIVEADVPETFGVPTELDVSATVEAADELTTGLAAAVDATVMVEAAVAVMVVETGVPTAEEVMTREPLA
jgi:hypothetical protein